MAIRRIRLGGITVWPVAAVADPVLRKDEVAIDTDTGVIKVGDGETAFSGLPAAGNADVSVKWGDIDDKPAVIAAGANAAAARAAIGAAAATDIPSLDGVPVIVEVPEAADAAGTPGQIAFDAQHLYVCVAADTWVRAELTDTW
ncbi:gp5 [Mycobacterium phage Brujita]|nr:gp5 [Mycobacterium phage Brujita]ACI06219.1 hypothetical protein BRUJITA_5 [Mycobacterium phage Brujita]